MTRRFALTVAACLFAASMPSLAASQAKPAAPAKPAPAAPAQAAPAAPGKWVPPIKGNADVEYIQGKTERVKLKGGEIEIQTKVKVKNISKGAIHLLQVEEIWYNTKREIATNGVYKHKPPLNPGEIVEFTLSSPNKADLYTNMLMFKHAWGTIKPHKVTKFE